MNIDVKRLSVNNILNGNSSMCSNDPSLNQYFANSYMNCPMMNTPLIAHSCYDAYTRNGASATSTQQALTQQFVDLPAINQRVEYFSNSPKNFSSHLSQSINHTDQIMTSLLNQSLISNKHPHYSFLNHQSSPNSWTTPQMLSMTINPNNSVPISHQTPVSNSNNGLSLESILTPFIMNGSTSPSLISSNANSTNNYIRQEHSGKSEETEDDGLIHSSSKILMTMRMGDGANKRQKVAKQ